ncbi:hypothetical protein [Amycolatopsis sp. cmx-8-4]|uniref:hypothetical protein n=1 Tax=Amycolatopsis sp. cmx-8-4 TaxID=2790947 RepID=UPI00397873D2
MNRQQVTPADWSRWRHYVSGSENEDLAEVFENIRKQTTANTKAKWARDERTRTFCDLALHLLYQHHIMRTPRQVTDEVKIFANVQAAHLADHAQSGFFDDRDFADSLSVDRFSATWGHQGAFFQDLIAYLFRPEPYLRRVREMHPGLIEMAGDLTLEQWIKRTGKIEIESLRSNPMVSLHTFIETVLPTDPLVRSRVASLRSTLLQQWATLYERVFSAYGLSFRSGRSITFNDLAAKFSTIACGAFVRSQTRDDAASSIDGDILGQLVVDLLPAFFEISSAEVETRLPR